MSTIYGRPLFIGGGNPKVPEIFGTGADGDLYIAAGETVTLPVPVPHQSIIEMQYKSITIEAGGTLTTSDPNAGLVLRCQGDCVIHGTIDQSGKAPKTNPDSTYQYPEELQCGDGGNGGRGGNSSYRSTGGTAMEARIYGGGYGAGGGGGSGYYNTNNQRGGTGGSTNSITIDTPDESLFVGGEGGTYGSSSLLGLPGSNGGGGGGTYYSNSGDQGNGGNGGDGPGGAGVTTGDAGGGGGAGNYGGGVLMLYVGGNFLLDGEINCSGLPGGAGGYGRTNRSGGGGGGGGGGSVYIVHNGTQTVTGNLNVNGGAGGTAPNDGLPGAAGGIGTTTIKQYEESA